MGSTNNFFNPHQLHSKHFNPLSKTQKHLQTTHPYSTCLTHHAKISPSRPRRRSLLTAPSPPPRRLPRTSPEQLTRLPALSCQTLRRAPPRRLQTVPAAALTRPSLRVRDTSSLPRTPQDLPSTQPPRPCRMLPTLSR